MPQSRVFIRVIGDATPEDRAEVGAKIVHGLERSDLFAHVQLGNDGVRDGDVRVVCTVHSRADVGALGRVGSLTMFFLKNALIGGVIAVLVETALRRDAGAPRARVELDVAATEAGSGRSLGGCGAAGLSSWAGTTSQAMNRVAAAAVRCLTDR